MEFMNPPYCNGVATLTEEIILGIRTKLKLVVTGFVPTINKQSCDMDYIVSAYNTANAMKINGDTASMILGYMTDEEMQGTLEMPQP